MKRKTKRRPRPAERLIFSLRGDGAGLVVVPGPGIDPIEAATTAVRAFGEAQAEATRQRALPGAKAKRAKAKDRQEAHLPRVVALVKAGDKQASISATLAQEGISCSTSGVERLIRVARQRGLLPPA
jgi:hypothetical protein